MWHNIKYDLASNALKGRAARGERTQRMENLERLALEKVAAGQLKKQTLRVRVKVRNRHYVVLRITKERRKRRVSSGVS